MQNEYFILNNPHRNAFFSVERKLLRPKVTREEGKGTREENEGGMTIMLRSKPVVYQRFVQNNGVSFIFPFLGKITPGMFGSLTFIYYICTIFYPSIPKN